MLTSPMDVLSLFPVRKNRNQKQAFLDAVQSYLRQIGYDSHVELGSFGCRNLVFGNPDTARYLVTAHYDTCARMCIPNLAMPCNPVLYFGYQLMLVFAIMLGAVVLGVLVRLFSGSDLLGSIVSALLVWLCLGLMVFGPANPSNANDNTSGVITLLEIARSMPEIQRSQVCFVLFALEEAGLIGSTSYRKAHKKATDRQLVINLDCVGEGNEILMFPTKRLKKDKYRCRPLYDCCGYFGGKSLLVRDKGPSIYPSDQMSFPYGVGIAALKRGKLGLYLDRIHTSKDTVLDQTNVNILRAAIVSMVSCGAVKKG